MKEDTYDVIEKYGKVKGLNKEKHKVEGGKIDLCKAMEDWAREERKIGHESGIREGRESGLREGRESGLREGRDSGIRFVVENMLKEGMADEEIIRFTQCSRELIEELKFS